MKNSISENNPNLEEMRERGWAWLQRSIKIGGGHKHGAPYTDDQQAAEAVERLHPYDEGAPLDDRPLDEAEEIAYPGTQELIIVYWEDDN